MLYELIAVVRPNLQFVKEIAKTTGQQIIQNKGVIRSITNWGTFELPKPTTKHQTRHHKGHYTLIQFDGSAAIQQEIRRQLGLHPHMIRFSVVKIGDKLGGKQKSIEGVTGEIPWKTEDNEWVKKFKSMQEDRREQRATQYQAKLDLKEERAEAALRDQKLNERFSKLGGKITEF